MTATARPSALEPSQSVDEVAAAFKRCRPAFFGVGVFSTCVNVLSLTGSLYMLQISDRVLASRSFATLVGLSLLALAAYFLMGVLDALRNRMLSRVGAKFGDALIGRVYDTMTALSLKGVRSVVMTQVVRDLDQVQKFLSGSGPTAFFDMPFMPFFFVIASLMHPLFGWLIVFGTLVTIVLAIMTELRTRDPTMAATISAAARHAIAEASIRNAAVLKAMGMSRVFADNFAAANTRFTIHNLESSDASNGIKAIAKAFRGGLQSAVYGVGAYLAIMGEVSPGSMIAASILTARALAPIEVAVANWRGFVAARQGFDRLRKLLAETSVPQDRVALPDPERKFSVENLYVAAPGAMKPIIQDVSFQLEAGQALAVIGPSASGKSTLARALIGVWPAARGRVCFDGAPIEHWDSDRLGRHIGYLPQDVELFDGTVAANIARFEPNAEARNIVQAAREAGVHNMILRLPEGYETRIGEGGASLSAGQRQRVALARALYRQPFVVVLDEPNSNLDSEGEDALVEAISSVRRRGGIAIVVTHRPTALSAVNLVAVMINGRLQAFGPKESVIKGMTKQGQQQSSSLVRG